MPGFRAKHQRKFVTLEITKQNFPQFQAEWNLPFFITLALNDEEEVVEVHLSDLKGECLIYSHPTIKQCQHEGVHPPLTPPFRFKGDDAGNLFGGKGR